MSLSTKLHWDIYGKGENLILIHGWGMNGAVWQQVVEELSQYFCVHVVDLPGYGHSHQVQSHSLAEIATAVLEDAPEKAIWLGWSLGGLVATHVALHHPERVLKLITLASSPRFSAEGRLWRGIDPKVLNDFTHQLTNDFQGTIERFMALQAMGSPSARQDVKQLKSVVLSRPMPNPKALHLGLELLATIDYRQQLNEITVPIHRLYGRLDGLVPVKVAAVLDKQLQAQSHIFKASSHAPFMSEKQAFCELIQQL
ncbi:pimeloyl-[acyl-carrier protein] methyl ester esterase [Vibrio sp. UCD-FRSSP16_10]|uniref:pimeloyl-ACP methyl ester esterase BioH n=1 Tax=unclassified Vibrio TaxID=2614977 RepID=UPI000801E9DE|nr:MULTISPECIES: pimeloyl-ACP methyl ester esterase BioH [unclassified Vibrio]OBT10135.1 pimeloyl-[acyl-carrier protein] methyl ester esterase [Vibrio sp. UCD-FRSSP16_30]OBT18925.1 pimeloyl-[acyl-carrier protein] methyl ester esterase [Vibrio sp. UCD-FRSSP16_10]